MQGRSIGDFLDFFHRQFKNITKKPVVVDVNTKPYITLDPAKSTGAHSSQRRVMNRLSRDYDLLLETQDNIQYIINNPDEFIAVDINLLQKDIFFFNEALKDISFEYGECIINSNYCSKINIDTDLRMKAAQYSFPIQDPVYAVLNSGKRNFPRRNYSEGETRGGNCYREYSVSLRPAKLHVVHEENIAFIAYQCVRHGGYWQCGSGGKVNYRSDDIFDGSLAIPYRIEDNGNGKTLFIDKRPRDRRASDQPLKCAERLITWFKNKNGRRLPK